VAYRPRWRKVVALTLWLIPEAAVTVWCTPDDGCDRHPKHVEWFAVNKNLHTVVSCWTLLIKTFEGFSGICCLYLLGMVNNKQLKLNDTKKRGIRCKDLIKNQRCGNNSDLDMKRNYTN